MQGVEGWDAGGIRDTGPVNCLSQLHSRAAVNHALYAPLYN
jgi:hypothetical protein